MADYYVTRQANASGHHDVHREGCSHMPDAINRIYLGEFNSCEGAVEKAKSV